VRALIGLRHIEHVDRLDASDLAAVVHGVAATGLCCHRAPVADDASISER
jgi:hypothetical protein